jgi:hypothetical protein
MYRKVLGSTLFAACVLTVMLAANAYAGKYHAYACRTPLGEVAPASGWTGSVAKGGAYDQYALNTCAEGGGLLAALGEETNHASYIDDAAWTFEVPTLETMTAATFWRADYVKLGAINKYTYITFLEGGSGGVLGECNYDFGCRQQGSLTEPLAAENKITVPTNQLGSVSSHVICVSSQELNNECPHGSETGGYTGAVYIYASDIVLEQTEIPSASEPGGPLATETPVHGISDLTFKASDPASGVYQAVFSIDGSVVQSTTINENEGHCKNVGETTDGLPAFLYVQPCPKSVSADVGFDTTKVSNGKHHLVVTVTDPAGNSAFVLDREIEVNNPPPVEFLWKIAGVTLKETETRAITTKAAPAGAGKTFVLEGKDAGQTIKVESSTIKSSTGNIEGGKPGTVKETLEFENVKVAAPEKCEVKENKIVTLRLLGEIIERAETKEKVTKGLEKAGLLLTPKEGTLFAKFEMTGAECPLKGKFVKVEGSTLAETLPQKQEVETPKLKFGKGEMKTYKNNKGEVKNAELKVESKGMIFEGEAEVTVGSKKVWGAF